MSECPYCTRPSPGRGETQVMRAGRIWHDDCWKRKKAGVPPTPPTGAPATMSEPPKAPETLADALTRMAGGNVSDQQRMSPPDPSLYKGSQQAGGFKAPPIAGYQDVSGDKAATVNNHKVLEEHLLRVLDAHKLSQDVDQRWLAIARTHIEEGFMALNRSIFRPQRIKLPGDAP